MVNDQKRQHEIRVGMSVYWAQTWPEHDGYAWEASGVKGWAHGTRHDAVSAARETLRKGGGQ